MSSLRFPVNSIILPDNCSSLMKNIRVSKENANAASTHSALDVRKRTKYLSTSFAKLFISYLSHWSFWNTKNCIYVNNYFAKGKFKTKYPKSSKDDVAFAACGPGPECVESYKRDSNKEGRTTDCPFSRESHKIRYLKAPLQWSRCTVQLRWSWYACVPFVGNLKNEERVLEWLIEQKSKEISRMMIIITGVLFFVTLISVVTIPPGYEYNTHAVVITPITLPYPRLP